MLQGWVSLHRDIINWEWYDDVNTCRVFIHCLLRANHEPAKWRGIDIDRGQFISSVSKLALETSLSVKQVRTSLGKLNKTGEVASEGRTQHTVFTIKNYDKYQSSGKPSGKQKASDGQAKGKRGATNNNNNNEDNENNEDIPSRFEEFWDLYGKKTGRDVCERKFNKLKESDVTKIFEVLPSYVASTPEVKFRRNPSTWLNQKGWEDEIIKGASQNGSGGSGSIAADFGLYGWKG